MGPRRNGKIHASQGVIVVGTLAELTACFFASKYLEADILEGRKCLRGSDIVYKKRYVHRSSGMRGRESGIGDMKEKSNKGYLKHTIKPETASHDKNYSKEQGMNRKRHCS